MIFRNLGQLAAAYAASLGGEVGPVTFGTIGLTSGTGNAFTDPTYPTGLTAGDLIIMVVVWADTSEVSTIAYSDDWMEVGGSIFGTDSIDLASKTFFRVSDGTETGTITGFEFTGTETATSSTTNYIYNGDALDAIQVATVKVSNVSRIVPYWGGFGNTAIPTITSAAYSDGEGSLVYYANPGKTFVDPTEFDSFNNVFEDRGNKSTMVIGEKEHTGSGTFSATAVLTSFDSTSYGCFSNHMILKKGTIDSRYPKERRRSAIATTSGPSVTISPSSGDLILVFTCSESSTDVTANQPVSQSGFTTLVSAYKTALFDANMTVQYKVSDGTETTISSAITTATTMHVYVFEGLSYVSSSVSTITLQGSVPGAGPDQTGATSGDIVLEFSNGFRLYSDLPDTHSATNRENVGDWADGARVINNSEMCIGHFIDSTATWTSPNTYVNSSSAGHVFSSLILRPT